MQKKPAAAETVEAVLGPVAASIHANVEEDDETPHCYMCMESTRDVEFSPMELIAPCACASLVHRDCLDRWRVSSTTFHAMTRCPTCHTRYEIEEVAVANEAELKTALRREQLWRWVLVVGVIVVGSLLIWLVDAGTPAVFALHWNAMNGQIYHAVGFPNVPRFLVYLALSVAMTAFITGLVAICAWCAQDGNGGAFCDCVSACDDCCWGRRRRRRHGYHGGGGLYVGGDCVQCGECGGECGGEFAMVLAVIIVVGIIFVGIAVIMTAVVGGIGSVVDRRGERRIRSLETQHTRVRNRASVQDIV
ncbi:Aste57867_17912 [Aphanomyces stellatus]|uniref:Aste57867_17912 protein n=1 Tax=Aphanomyces stellatus TaxID=120398 RepID=A0A485LCD5_9STRA|nr:hypothetical protein As57867_017851 [Aphanomyces stellatus]VFT94654.1 Aste57867_17912 [Aphanomyces stellatus]